MNENENENKKNAEKIVEKIKELVKKGNVSKIIIEKNGNTIVNLPLNAGIIGLALAPWAMLIATLITLGTDCNIKLETIDNSTIDVSTEEYNDNNSTEENNDNN